MAAPYGLVDYEFSYAPGGQSYKATGVVPTRAGVQSTNPYIGSNPYGTQSQQPNQAVQRVLNDTYNQAIGLAQNPTTKVVANTKSPAVASRVGGLYSQYDTNKAAKDVSIADYVNELIAQKPKNRAAMDEESGSISRVYGTGPGSLASDLAASAKRRASSVRSAASSAINRARRDNNVSRMLGGNSSYLDRAYADSLARIMAEEGIGNADIERSNILDVQGQRNNLLGQRQTAADRFAASLVQPVDALNRYSAGQASELGSIANLEDANTYYQYLTPEQQIAMRLGLVDQANGIQDQLGDYQPQYFNASQPTWSPPGEMNYSFTPPSTPLAGSAIDQNGISIALRQLLGYGGGFPVAGLPTGMRS